jgi:hypothetical protein
LFLLYGFYDFSSSGGGAYSFYEFFAVGVFSVFGCDVPNYADEGVAVFDEA